jgi:hypothetical protein
MPAANVRTVPDLSTVQRAALREARRRPDGV